MQLKDNKSIKKAVVLIAVVAITGAIGVALSAQMGPRRGMAQDPGMPGGPPPDDQRGPGMMGGRGMRGGPGMMGGPGMRGPGGPMGIIGFGLRELDLTDAQHDQIRAVMESHATEFEAAATRMRDAREALHEAIASEGADEATVRQKAAAVGAVEAEIAVLQVQVRKDVFAVLTPEQQKKVQELRTEMQNRMKNRRERIRTEVDDTVDDGRGGPQAV